MVSASVFGLVDEGLAEGTTLEITAGMAVGVVLVIVAHEILVVTDIDPHEYEVRFQETRPHPRHPDRPQFPEGFAVGAVMAFAFVRLARDFFYFGFASGRLSTSYSPSSSPRHSNSSMTSPPAGNPNSLPGSVSGYSS